MDDKKQKLRDELARALKAEYENSDKQQAADDEKVDTKPEDRHLKINQSIVGSNNSVSQSVNYIARDGFDPNNPNIIECPCCWNQASKLANCINCNLDIPAYFHSLEVERREQIAKKQAEVTLIASLACFGLNWLTGYSMFIVAGIGLLFIATSLSKLSGK
jgi:hypothetical protein